MAASQAALRDPGAGGGARATRRGLLMVIVGDG